VELVGPPFDRSGARAGPATPGGPDTTQVHGPAGIPLHGSVATGDHGTTGAGHTIARAARTTVGIDVAGLRYLGGAMVVLGVGLPLLPHNPGLPCPLRTVTGVPCPLCGMTTAVKALLHAHVHDSVAANPFGIVAVLLAVVLVLRPHWRRVNVPLALVVAAGLCSWGWELHRFGFV